MSPRTVLGSLAVALLTIPVAGPAAAAPPERVRFNRDVRPILADACFSCHGPAQQKAGLRLDRPESATKPNKRGDAAVVPGKPDASELVRRIHSGEETEQMPPADSHKTLTAAQKATLKRWVAEGAVYEAHWSFAKLTKPPVPAGPEGGNPIDAFLAEQIARAGLSANPEADRPTLIRRVAFALTGLPPTPKEVDTFLADTSPDAYEKMADRYLASPRFGEEMARHWLDLARYADTHGLHLDNERGTWPYRDWVVRAFNENKPFDRFTVEQLAGDLLPGPTKEQLVATGFNRCNVTTGEGGSIDAEWHFRNAVDRAAVAAETWLGLTAGCAQCHDHKFDPISQKEFYQLYAFFSSADGPALDGNALLHGPAVKLATPEQERKLADLDRRLAALHADIAAATARYADPAVVAAVAGPVAGKDAADPALSFRAWVESRGGPDKAKLPKDIAAILTGAKPNPQQMQQLRAHYLRHVCSLTPGLDPLTTARDAAAAERKKLDDSIPGSMIFRDAPTVRPAFVMLRGQYTKPGDPVEPNTPAALPPLPPTKGRPTRLDLARWVVSPENPLTARVHVNRLWQQFFGTGLSRTSSDVGVQGEPPTHPELLDWLASEFMRPTPANRRRESPGGPTDNPANRRRESPGGPTDNPANRRRESPGGPTDNPANQRRESPGGPTDNPANQRRESPGGPTDNPATHVAGSPGAWDIKHMVRLLVTSAAFRRSAKVTPELLRADPENRLYARGPRFRLDAEQVRDNALFVGGLLDPTLGGKGVKPYQPENIWEPVAYTGSNTRNYKPDSGPALYRRSLCTFFKRTAPPPFLANFDAPNREQPCGRRDRSNTPLQALQLLNDVQHVEAARAFAERILTEGGPSPTERIAFAFQAVLARQPSAAELRVLEDELTAHLARYAKAPDDAKKLIAVGESKPKAGAKPDELAAYTLVASTLLNLDETLTRN